MIRVLIISLLITSTAHASLTCEEYNKYLYNNLSICFVKETACQRELNRVREQVKEIRERGKARARKLIKRINRLKRKL